MKKKSIVKLFAALGVITALFAFSTGAKAEQRYAYAPGVLIVQTRPAAPVYYYPRQHAQPRQYYHQAAKVQKHHHKHEREQCRNDAPVKYYRTYSKAHYYR